MFQHILYKKQLRAQILVVINGSRLAFILDPKLGPVNNPYLDQLITIKNGLSFLFFFAFLGFKTCAEIPIL